MANIRKHLQVINELRKLNRFDYLKEAPEKPPSVTGIDDILKNAPIASTNDQILGYVPKGWEYRDGKYQPPKIDLTPPTENNNLFYGKTNSGWYKLVNFNDMGVFVTQKLSRDGGFYAKDRFPYTYMIEKCLPKDLDEYRNPYPQAFAQLPITQGCYAKEKKKAADDRIRQLQAEKNLVCAEYTWVSSPQKAQIKNPKYNAQRCLELTNLLAPKSQTSIHSPGWVPPTDVYSVYLSPNQLNTEKKPESRGVVDDMFNWFGEHPFLTELGASLIVAFLTGGQSLLVQALFQAGVSATFAIPKAINGDWAGFALSVAVGMAPTVTRGLKLGVKSPMKFLNRHSEKLASFTTKAEVNAWANTIIQGGTQESRLLLKAVKQTPNELKLKMKKGLGEAFLQDVKNGVINVGKLTRGELSWWKILLWDAGITLGTGVVGTAAILFSQPTVDEKKLAKEYEDKVKKSNVEIKYDPKTQETLDNQREEARQSGNYKVVRKNDPESIKKMKEELNSIEGLDLDKANEIINKHNPSVDTVFFRQPVNVSTGGSTIERPD